MRAALTTTAIRPRRSRTAATKFQISARIKPPQTILGAEQKAWFLERLKNSKATWKIWGNTIATLDMRADPQNLPGGLTKAWPGAGYAGFGGGDHSTAFVERAEIYDFVRDNGITGFATIAGDRHSFWAGSPTKSLPPQKFRTSWHRFRHRLHLRAGDGRGARAHLSETASASPALSRPRTSGYQTAADHQYVAAPRGSFLPRVCQDRRHRESTRAVQPESVAASFLRGYGRPRLCRRPRNQRLISNRNSSASRARSSAATVPMEAPWPTAPATPPIFGAKANPPNWKRA